MVCEVLVFGVLGFGCVLERVRGFWRGRARFWAWVCEVLGVLGSGCVHVIDVIDNIGTCPSPFGIR